MVFRPSGEQMQLRHGASTAVVVEVGGGLRSYDVDGVPVIDGFGEDEMASAGRGQVLLPWPNRVDGGSWRWQDKDQQLAITEVKKNNANHGLVRWAGWQLAREDEATAVARHVVHPQTGYPFRLAAELRYQLSDDGLTVSAQVENRSDVPAPFGLGFHPFLSTGARPVDDAQLAVPASTYFEVDERGLPGERRSVEGGDYDFRTAQRVGAQVLDTPYTDLARVAGRAEVVLETADGRRSLWCDEAFGYLQVFTGDTVPQVDRRRYGVAVEPMTCPANAFNSGDGLVVLEPGASFEGSWGIRAFCHRASGNAREHSCTRCIAGTSRGQGDDEPTGRTSGVSVDRKIWTVTLDGTEHEVMLLWTYWSGHREVLLDGKSVHSSSFPLRWRSEQPFDIGSHRCVVRTKPATKISPYFVLSLEVDGKEIPPNPGTTSQWEKRSAAR